MSPHEDVHKEIELLEQRYAENPQGLVFAHLADAYRRVGEYAKAEGLLLHGLKTHPSYTSAYNVLGRVYLESERYDEANEQFSKVLELDTTNLIALRALGDIAARSSQPDDARVWYERMLQIDPRSVEATEALRRLEDTQGATGEGREATKSRDLEAAEAAWEVTEPEELYPPVAEAPEPAAERSGSPIDAVPSDSGPLTGQDAEPAAGPSTDGDEPPGRLEGADTFDDLGALGPLEGLVSEEDLPGFSPGPAPPAEPQESPPWWEVPPVGGTEPPSLAEFGSDEGELPPPAVGGDNVPADLSGASDFELPEMDDWSPGFIGDLVDAQGEDSFDPEAILRELGDDLNFDIADEEEETPKPSPSTGLVTETMAELYANQGLYSDALAVYQKLADSDPFEERYQEKIAELERKLADAEPVARTPAGSEERDLARLMDLTEPTPIEELQVAPAEPDAGSVDDSFAFEDEAPLAGFEQLDPFASSFDVLASPGDTSPDEPGLPAAEAETESEPTPPVEFEAVADLEPVADFDTVDVEPAALAGDAESVYGEDEEPAADDDASFDLAFPASTDAAPTGEEEPSVLASEEVELFAAEPEYAGLAEAPSEPAVAPPENVWELATEPDASEIPDDDAAPVPSPDPGLVEVGAEVTAPAPFHEAEMRRGEGSIEDYLSGLLSYQAGSGAGTKRGVVEAAAEPPAEEPPGPEDLEKFQEWLRSLKR